MSSDAKEWMTDRELAEWLSISRVKLQQDRAKGLGPPFARIGRSVRYRRQDVEAWIAGRMGGGAGVNGGKAGGQ